MKARLIRRSGAALGGAALVGALLVSPAAAGATPYVAQGGGSCTVAGGTLHWGVKESFRSYISGSIANGSWETSDGAEYETPDFIWSNPTGEFDPGTGTGAVSFTGTVHFAGHDGVLDLTLANPTIEFEGDGSAALMLDAKSTDMEGETAIDEQQEWVGAVSAPDAISPADDRIELADLPVSLTNSGAGAFAGFYEADAELDPLNLVLEFDGCAGSGVAPVEQTPAQPEQTEQPVTVAAEQNIPWLPIGIGAAALLVIGLTVGMLIGGRRKSGAPETQDQQPASDASPESVEKLFRDQ